MRSLYLTLLALLCGSAFAQKVSIPVWFDDEKPQSSSYNSALEREIISRLQDEIFENRSFDKAKSDLHISVGINYKIRKRVYGLLWFPLTLVGAPWSFPKHKIDVTIKFSFGSTVLEQNTFCWCKKTAYNCIYYRKRHKEEIPAELKQEIVSSISRGVKRFKLVKEGDEWSKTLKLNTANAYSEFIKNYPSSFYKADAERMLKRVQLMEQWPSVTELRAMHNSLRTNPGDTFNMTVAAYVGTKIIYTFDQNPKPALEWSMLNLDITNGIYTENGKVRVLDFNPMQQTHQVNVIVTAKALKPAIKAQLVLPLYYDVNKKFVFGGAPGADGARGMDGRHGAAGADGSATSTSRGQDIHGKRGENGLPGNNGGNGGNGENGDNVIIYCDVVNLKHLNEPVLKITMKSSRETLSFYANATNSRIEISVSGGRGGNGGSGGNGGNGGEGGRGANGIDGAKGAPCKSGGNGGNGGDGAQGGNGANAGDGGSGGNGGNGGSIKIYCSSKARTYVDQLFTLRTEAGAAGFAGQAGMGGTGGKGGQRGMGGAGGEGGKSSDCPAGSAGIPGTNGRPGRDGYSGSHGRYGTAGVPGRNGGSTVEVSTKVAFSW